MNNPVTKANRSPCNLSGWFCYDRRSANLRSAAIVLPLLLLVQSLRSAAAETRTFARALDSIKQSELRAHVDVLADDTFEGREAGAGAAMPPAAIS